MVDGIVQVSIPVRGRGYGKELKTNIADAYNGFPSPLGEEVMESPRIPGETDEEYQIVSIPVRGRGYGKVDFNLNR